MKREKVVALTKISSGWKISINKAVRDLLEKEGGPLKEGDTLLYISNSQGEVILKRS